MRALAGALVTDITVVSGSNKIHLIRVWWCSATITSGGGIVYTHRAGRNRCGFGRWRGETCENNYTYDYKK
jgi:hypothetical protein